MRALDSPTCLLALHLHGQRLPPWHAKRRFMQSNNTQAVCPNTMPRAQMFKILASNAFHPFTFPVMSTFTTAITFLRSSKTRCTKRGTSKKRQWIFKTAPVCCGIPSEPLHGQHTPATPHPQERRNGSSIGLQRPKQVTFVGGAKTCYSWPTAIFRSHSTGTYYIYRTCIYYKVHTCMYYGYSACMHYGYITCTLCHCSTCMYYSDWAHK